jgi:hypothetical protein
MDVTFQWILVCNAQQGVLPAQESEALRRSRRSGGPPTGSVTRLMTTVALVSSCPFCRYATTNFDYLKFVKKERAFGKIWKHRAVNARNMTQQFMILVIFQQTDFYGRKE